MVDFLLNVEEVSWDSPVSLGGEIGLLNGGKRSTYLDLHPSLGPGSRSRGLAMER
jgi:hypothetical protein